MTVAVTDRLESLRSRAIGAVPDDLAFQSEEIRLVDNFRQTRFHALRELPSYADDDFVESDRRHDQARAEALDEVETVFHLLAVTNAPGAFDAIVAGSCCRRRRDSY